MIRCIAFDAVGTLIEPDPPVAVAYHHVAARAGSRLSVEEIRRRFAEAFAASEHSDWTADAMAASEEQERSRWRRIVSHVICDVTDPEPCFLNLWDHFALPDSWRCFPDVSECVTALRARGLRLMIASNFDARLRRVLAGLPPLAGIDRLVISSEAGYRKPSPHFFERLVEAAACPPAEILLVGDDWRNDVLGARNAGLKSAWLQRKHENSSESADDAVWTVRTLGEISSANSLSASLQIAEQEFADPPDRNL